jgi:glycerol uptake facilitator-like aquaporin
MKKLLGPSLAEFFGTLVLVCVVVGSGIMGTNLSADAGIALLINTVSTIFALALLILILGPVSGAQFNPVVSLVLLLQKKMPVSKFFAFVPAQILGAIAGAILANQMFNLEAVQVSEKYRISSGTLIGEVLATAGLLIVILVLTQRKQEKLIAISVAAWIGSAYFFTSSTSFANPAVTIGRVFSDTFAGISPDSVIPFIGAQLIGMIFGILGARLIQESESSENANSK